MRFVGCYTDSPFVCSWEEIGYESGLTKWFGMHGDALSVSASEPSFEVVKLVDPFVAVWFIEGDDYWARYFDMECRCHAASIMPSFVG